LSSCPTPNSKLSWKVFFFCGAMEVHELYTSSNQRVEIILFHMIHTKMGWGGDEGVSRMQLHNGATDHFGNVIKLGIIKRGCSEWGCC
jgi:hypothetical protein